MFNYFEPWHYGLVIVSIAFLYASILVFRNEKNLTASLILLLCGSVIIHWFAISLDPFLNLWDEQFHALVARNCTLHALKPTLYEYPFYPIYYQNWAANHVWIHKQPLFMWQMALSLKLFGFNEIALRIPNFIMMTLGSLIVFRIGQLVSGSKTGLYAAVIFTTLYYGIQLTSGFEATDHNDVAFLFYVLASLWAWTEFYTSGNRKWIWLIAVFAGCAVLNKWLTGLLVYGVWGISLLFYLKRPVSLRVFVPLLLSFLLSVVIFLPWQIFCAIDYPLESIWERTYNARHIFEAIEGHGGNQWYHLDKIALLYNSLAPYLIVPGFIFFVRNNKNAKVTAGLITGVILIYIFFTIAQTKMPAFTFPVSGIVCIALGSLFVSIESALVRISRWMIIPFVLLFFSFIYYNLNMQDIEKIHGRKKSNPQQNYYVSYRTRDAVFFKEISKTIDLKNNPVIFNVPLDVSPMLMFYSGATCYGNLPSPDDIEKLKMEGRPVYMLTKEKPEDYLEKNPAVHKIWYPENREVKRQRVSFKLSNNKWLSYEQFGNFNLAANRNTPGDWETFNMIQYADSSYSILADNNRFLTINLHGDQSMTFNPWVAREWEHIYLEKFPNGKIALKDCNNNFIYLKDGLLLQGGLKNFSKEAEMEILIHP